MGKFVVGDVVAISFQFSGFSGYKLRPALVLASVEHDDLILCQLTSKSYASKIAIGISDSDFSEGGLPLDSYIRPDKLFTAESTIIKKQKGKLNKQALGRTLDAVLEIFSKD